MTKEIDQSQEKLCCGLVMPISPIDGCNEQHWLDVKEILTEVVEATGLKANLVSHADDAGIIQKRIIQNLYKNPIIVCDVSGKNPNVMFELGMRLAFDKPTIIVKDDKTSYSFDTSAIEHLEYPRDLRFTQIVEFKESLKNKIQATLKIADSDPSYTTFLKHFGTFVVAKLETKVVSKEDFIIKELKELKQIIMRQQFNNEQLVVDSDPNFKQVHIDRVYMKMFNSLKNTMSNHYKFFEINPEKLKSKEFRDEVYYKGLETLEIEKLGTYFKTAGEFRSAFDQVYDDMFL